jgi:hypothetical protein
LLRPAGTLCAASLDLDPHALAATSTSTGEDGLLSLGKHYKVDVAGEAAWRALPVGLPSRCSIEPPTRRRVYVRDEDVTATPDKMTVSVDRNWSSVDAVLQMGRLG